MATRWIDTKDLCITDMQLELVSQLEIHEMRAARAYEGVLHLLYGKRHPGWESLLAYGLRDIIDILVGAREHDLKEGEKKEGRHKRLARTFDRTTHSKYDLGTEYNALTSIRGEIKGMAHRGRPIEEERLLSMASEIERILHKLTASQTVVNDRVDEIMSGPHTAEGAAELVNMISTGATQYHIIGRLPPRWVDFMAEAGFFRDSEKYWAAHRYLYRCTRDHPGSVARIITSYDPKAVEGNDLLYIDILELALQIPAKHAETVARYLLEKGLYSKFERDPGRYFEIVRRTYAGGRRDLAAGLLYKALSQLWSSGAQSRHGLVLDRVGSIIKENPGEDLLPLLRTMADLLDRYIDTGTDPRTSAEDSSLSRERPYISDSEDNMPDTIKTAMITHVRDCLHAVGRGGGNLQKALDAISGRRHLVWRRMEMHVYCKFPGFEDQMIGHALKYAWEYNVRHEYREMLGHMGSIPDDAKERIQEAIMAGPGKDEMGRLRAKHGGRTGTVLDYRRLQLLEAASGWIDEERLAAYSSLAKKYEGGQEDEVPELAGKSTGEVFDIMGRLGPEAAYGTLSEFSGVVRDDSGAASEMAMQLKGADPAVQAKFFAGLEEAVREGGAIQWDGVMQLVRHVVSHLSERYHRTSEPVIAACHMMRAIMRRKKNPAPRAQAWEAASALARRRPAGRGFGKEEGMFTRSLNDIEGLSFHIMVLYVLWDAGDGLSQKARKMLDGYIGDPGTHEASRNAVLGAYMPSLSRRDRGWALGMAEILLGGDGGAAFWNGYVMMNPPYLDFFPALAKWYDRFLNGDGNQRGSRMHMETFSHVLAVYLHGPEADDIFGRFVGSIRADETGLVDRCVSGIDMAIKSLDDPDIDWDKIGALWTHKAFLGRDLSVWLMGSKHGGMIKHYARHVEERAGMHAEFTMTDMLVDELGKHASEFPSEVAGILGLMVDRPAGKLVPRGIHAVLDKLEGAGGGVARAAVIIRERAATLGCEPV